MSDCTTCAEYDAEKGFCPKYCDVIRKTVEALVEVVRCNQCRYYLGNHDVPGCAPCNFWGIGEVMWDDYCKRGERYDSD